MLVLGNPIKWFPNVDSGSIHLQFDHAQVWADFLERRLHDVWVADVALHDERRINGPGPMRSRTHPA